MPPNTAIERGTVFAMSRFEDSGRISRKRSGDRAVGRSWRTRLRVGRMWLSPWVIFALTCIFLLHNPSPHSVLYIGSCTMVSALDTVSESNQNDEIEAARRGSRSFVRKSISEGAPAKQRKPQDEGTLTLNQIFVRAGRRGLGGGLPGAIAGVVQVVTLMWLRTIMSYQSRYGGTFLQALRTLLNEGGVGRLYKGWYFGLIQAPVTRFVSTAANDGVESLLRSLEWTKAWGPGRSTIVASVFVGLFRMILMRTSIGSPRRVQRLSVMSIDMCSIGFLHAVFVSAIDTMKVVLQVDGSEGFRSLLRRLKAGKISSLYQGCIATALASMMGHYPWVRITTPTREGGCENT
jgi:hypothetical protein